MSSGKLYLIPTPLGEGDPARVLPASVLEIIPTLSCFVVEELRTARRFLSAAGLKGKIDTLEFHELNEHTDPRQVEPLASLFDNGRNVGLLSEAGLPAVADPGALLVALCHRHNIEVVPLVGPSSLMMALMIRANLHYALAPILMADIPEKSAWSCLKESIAMMRRRVMQLLSVIVSFVLYMLLVDLVVNLFAGISYPVALIVNLLLNLLITCYMRTTVCAYYEERMKENRKSDLDTEAETAEDTGDYLN